MLVTTIFSFYQYTFKDFILRIFNTSNCLVKVYPFPKRQILDASKLKAFADDNFKFDENS